MLFIFVLKIVVDPFEKGGGRKDDLPWSIIYVLNIKGGMMLLC